MTRRELYNYAIQHGCTTLQIPEYKAKVIYVENTLTGGRSWINLPVNDYVVRDYTVFKLCNDLGIPIPSHTEYMQGVHDRINKHLKN